MEKPEKRVRTPDPFIMRCYGGGFVVICAAIAIISYAWLQTERDVPGAIVQTATALLCAGLLIATLRRMIRNYKKIKK